MRQTPQDKITVPDGDENLFLWTGILYTCVHKLGQLPPKTESESKYYTKRPDGGNYLALATLDVPDYKVSFNQRLYSYCGAMQTVSEKYPVASWQINTVFDGRTADLGKDIDRDYVFLYEFAAGQLPKNKANLEKYQRLYEMGYLRADDTPNLIFLKVTEDDVPHGGAGWWPIPLPPPSPALAEVSLAMAADIGETTFLTYPPHMRAAAKARGARPIADIRFSLYILHELLARGVLRLPSDTQKAGLTTLVLSDRLPG